VDRTRFSDRDEARYELERDGGREDEAAGLDPRDLVHECVAKRRGNPLLRPA
jgi:hypothetical protein